MPTPDRVHWSRAAHDWIEWARRPGHDAFWFYRSGLAALIGPGRGEALDVGCGEGRVARLLRELGYRVTAVDAVREMLAAARGAGSADAYAVAAAAALPFPDASFDLIVAYNVLMDLDDLAGALAEARRVIRADGRLVISIVHPLQDRGAFQSPGPDAVFALTADWFATTRFESRDARDGLAMDFAGWSRPLEAYVGALRGAGFALTDLREPPPDPGPLPGHLERARRVPMFQWLVADALPH